jgi:hypothetical protein
MSDELYSSIVHQLKGFDGVVQWFYLNEPLLDKRRYERIAALRQLAPKCTIHLTTNWDLMHAKTLDEQHDEIDALFEAGVNMLNLNDYDDKGYDRVVNTSGYRVIDHSWSRKSGQWISCGPLPGRYHAWGKGEARQSYCARPHRHIVVAFDGRVPVCCAADISNCETIGDANIESLEDIWQSRRMWDYRSMLQDKRRVWDCSGCDETMAFPHVVRKVKFRV